MLLKSSSSSCSVQFFSFCFIRSQHPLFSSSLFANSSLLFSLSSQRINLVSLVEGVMYCPFLKLYLTYSKIICFTKFIFDYICFFLSSDNPCFSSIVWNFSTVVLQYSCRSSSLRPSFFCYSDVLKN